MQANQGNGHVGNDSGGFGQRLDQMGDDARKFVDDAKGAVESISSTLDIRGRVERHPYGMVAAALGIGYVLGGGLFTPTTARIVRLAMKLAALPLVKDELIGMAEAAVDGFAGRGGGAAGPDSESYNPQGGSR